MNGAFSHGDVFGIVFAFSDLKFNPSTAIAFTDATVIKIPIVDIIHNDLLISTPIRRQYIQNVVNIIAQSAYIARLRVFAIAQPRLKDRIMTFLTEKSKHFHSNEFDIPYNRQELADFLCTDRTTLSSELGKLQSNGVIKFHKNHFVLLY